MVYQTSREELVVMDMVQDTNDLVAISAMMDPDFAIGL